MSAMPEVTIGNVITIVAFIFGMGGGWYSIKQALKDTQDKLDTDHAENKERLDHIVRDLGEIRNTYLTKELNAANERRFTDKMDDLSRRMLEVERSHRARD